METRSISNYTPPEKDKTFNTMAETEATEPTIKQCPFCGSKARMWKWGMGAHTVIECSNYDVDIHRVSMQGDTEEEAIAAWNRRASNG